MQQATSFTDGVSIRRVWSGSLMLPCTGTGIEVPAGFFRFSIQFRQIIDPDPFLKHEIPPFMENLVFGIITMLICLAGYLEAFRMNRKKRYMFALILLIVCGFLLRLYMAADFFLHEWDERYHALVAKNMMAHPMKPTLYDTPLLPFDYKNWTCNHIWIHKQPFPLWTMALSMSLFGVNEIALRLPSIILTTLGIWINYETGRFFFNRRVAFIAAFLYSIHGLIIEVTGGRVATDHIDTFFLFFI